MKARVGARRTYLQRLDEVTHHLVESIGFLYGDTVPIVFEEFKSGVRDELRGVFDGGDASPLLVGAGTD